MDKASLFFHRSWPRSVAGIQEILESNHLFVKTGSCYFLGIPIPTPNYICFQLFGIPLQSCAHWSWYPERDDHARKKNNALGRAKSQTLKHCHMFYVEEKLTRHTKIHVVCGVILSIENHATQWNLNVTFTNSCPASQLCRCASHGRRVPQWVPRERGRLVAKIDRCTWFMRSRT